MIVVKGRFHSGTEEDRPVRDWIRAAGVAAALCGAFVCLSVGVEAMGRCDSRGIAAGACSPSASRRRIAMKEQDPRALRLAPFPKQVRLAPGALETRRHLTISIAEGRAARRAAADLGAELLRAAGATCRIAVRSTGRPWIAVLAPRRVDRKAVRRALGVIPTRPEGYSLVVTPAFAAIGAQDERGLVWGFQTLRQLVRANMRGRALPCLSITDWPSIRYRAGQEDITRGPSPKLATLEREISIASLLRMNLYTYYLEHQFAFRKHPGIGPANGSFTPEELRALVAYAADRCVDILGCQQSFGHFGNILSRPEFAHLRETPDIIDPTNEESYRLLDDLYSEQAPLLSFPFFNVCCDETDGLGTGPSKSLAAQIGVGGVYARHMQRLHAILKERYGKRMMMWGDIISRHPEHLREIPKDTVLLSWGYSAEKSFDAAIAPFAAAGYEFFVCPGVSCWSRILPDFATAEVNIHNYVRDGARHGAIGVLNTVWYDDADSLPGPNVHGIAWGAECSWNGSSTSIEDFNRRIGAVLFGEKGDHFGRAIALLSKTHGLPGYDYMMNARFWQADTGHLPVDRATAERQARELLALVDPAIAHLHALRNEAVENGGAVDEILFGAERMRLIATRSLDYLSAADAYEEARAASSDPARARAKLDESVRLVTAIREAHRRLRAEYVRLRSADEKPYAMDWVTARYDGIVSVYEGTLGKLRLATAALDAGRPLPSAEEAGLGIVEAGARRTSAQRVLDSPLGAKPWAVADCPERVGISIEAAGAVRADMPIELDIASVVAAPCRAQLVELESDSGRQQPLLTQITMVNGRAHLLFLAAGATAAHAQRSFLLYLNPAAPPVASAPTVAAAPTVASAPGGVTVADAPRNMRRIDNGPVRLLIGPEGAHIYRWEIRGLGDRSITQPGETDWEGFADVAGPHRNAANRIELLASGPVLARLRCTDTLGLVKTFDIWAGVPWVECRLGAAVDWFACYDDISLMGADSPTPGHYLFSNGDTGMLKRLTNSSDCQDVREGQTWSAKFVPGGALIALLTPETAARLCVGPGGGMGAVFIQGGPAVSHFAIYGGVCPTSPPDALNALRASLDFIHPPNVDIYAVERQPR
jgi:hypothetical protein